MLPPAPLHPYWHPLWLGHLPQPSYHPMWSQWLQQVRALLCWCLPASEIPRVLLPLKLDDDTFKVKTTLGIVLQLACSDTSQDNGLRECRVLHNRNLMFFSVCNLVMSPKLSQEDTHYINTVFSHMFSLEFLCGWEGMHFLLLFS